MAEINTDPNKIDEILSRGVHEIYTKEDLKERLLSGKQLHLKLGIDVTGPNIHLGHAVVQRKIRDFQELGHRVTLIIGDFTTLVGDHSDKVEMRGETNSEEIKQNERTYVEQFFKTVHKEGTEIKHNSEWLAPLNFNDVIHLAKQFTISQMLDRETFMLRYKDQKPIGLDEFLYPLMQGYDSVALKCDVEFGGTDQTFNLLAGRKLMETFNMTPQSAVVMKLLTGSDGRPMGKSLKNFIPIMDNPTDMYGKVMSIVDKVLWEYFELATRIPMDEIAQMKEAVKKGENPMKYKKLLAREIVTFYHSAEEARNAEEYFEKTVQRKEFADEKVAEWKSDKKELPLLEALFGSLGEKYSSGEIKRVLAQKGVTVNGDKVDSKDFIVKVGDKIKFGKREFIKIV